jgi:DNA-binding XRE family transcriptional regulator
MSEAYIKKEILKKEIGMRFKVFRIYIKRNQKQLANELTVSPSTITNIEMGKIFPRITLQNYLNRKYNLNVNWLLSGSEEMIIPSVNASKTDNSFKLDDSYIAHLN